MTIDTEEKKVTFFHKFTFTMLGISSLIGWNAVCNSFGFFDSKYNKLMGNKQQISDFYFPIPLMFANFMWGPFMPYFSEKFSLFSRITFGLVSLSVVMLILPLIATELPQEYSGFTLCLICTYFIGSFNSIAQNSMIGMVSAVGGELISIYWVATGISGLTMNAAAAIAQASFGNSTDSQMLNGTIFYFCVAVFLSLLTIYMFKRLLNENKIIDQNGAPIKEKTQENEISAVSGQDEYTALNEESSGLGYGGEKSSAFSRTINQLKQGIMIARSIPLFIWIIYVQTFAMFPGVLISKGFQWNKRPNEVGFLSDWGILLIVTTYNIGDIFGKQITAYRKTFNYNIATIILFLRFGLFFSSLLIAASDDNLIPWVFVNAFIFATSNGYCTAAYMTLGPELTDEPQKKQVIGFINGFALTFGISIGTFVAMIFQNASEWDW